MDTVRIRQRRKAGEKLVTEYLRELVASGIISEEEYVFAVKFIDEAYKAMKTRAVYKRADKAAAIALVALYLSCINNKVLKKAMKHAIARHGASVVAFVREAMRRVRGEAWVGCIHKLASINCKPTSSEALMRSSNPGLDAYLIALNQCNKTTNKLFN